MKSSSDHYPELAVQSNGKTQVRFNIEPFTRTLMDKEQSGYNYEYVEIIGELTRPKIIDAVIVSRYSKDTELALINTEISSPGTEQYKQYKQYRAFAKEVSGMVLLALPEKVAEAAEEAAKVVVEAAMTQSIIDNLPARAAMRTAINNATTIPKLQAIILKMGEALYSHVKGTEA